VYYFVVVWLSVPVQSIAWKDSCLKVTYYVSSGMLNSTQSIAYSHNENHLSNGLTF